MSSEECNGWSNWETWNINLWLANDEGLYYETLRICDKEQNPHQYEFERDEELRDWVDELLEENIITDKVSLWRVNWKEIVESFQQTIEENKQYELQIRKAELGRRTN